MKSVTISGSLLKTYYQSTTVYSQTNQNEKKKSDFENNYFLLLIVKCKLILELIRLNEHYTILLIYIKNQF